MVFLHCNREQDAAQIWLFDFAQASRRRTVAATPTRPVPSSSKLEGSGVTEDGEDGSVTVKLLNSVMTSGLLPAMEIYPAPITPPPNWTEQQNKLTSDPFDSW
jgi:hypothetical protein